MALDLILRGGDVVDGTGSPRRKADVGVQGDRIVSIGDLSATDARLVLDVSGRVVTPGFIDAHTHSDLTLFVDGRAESKIRQGVTTEVTGNCSFSPYPVRPGQPDLLEHYELRAALDGVEWTWTDLDGYARRLEESRISVNIAPLVGNAALRIAVMGSVQRKPTPDELHEMVRLLDIAMEQGAFGMSVGLTLVPSSFADTNELVALASVVGRYNGLYVQHSRLWAGLHRKTIDEAIEIGRRAWCAVQISHQAIVDSREWGTADALAKMMEGARAEGVDVMYDAYPYTAAGTGLDQLVPTWIQDGGVEAMLARLDDPATFRKAVESTTNDGWFRGLPFDWTRLLITEVGTEGSKRYLGASLQQVADEWGIDGAEVCIELIRRERNRVGVVMFNRDEADVRYFIVHPLSMIGSDGSSIAPGGPFADTRPHPRFYGTFPRILGRYVREESLLTLEKAVHKMTGVPAIRFGLSDRGTVAEGQLADLVVFDPATVVDRATFESPHQFPTGIDHVFVAGQAVVSDGEHTGALPGRVLRAAGGRR
jgi:N-acyl-D-aspartate/D-glutamate deacylase